MDAGEPVIKVNGLRKEYEDVTAVSDISFQVAKGEIFGLLGPNGAGKTSTIRMLIGLASITSGDVHIAGYQLPQELTSIQAQIGVVPDESNLYPELTGYENLCFCGALYGMRKQARQKRAAELLTQFGLQEAAGRPFASYSRGMKRKLTIAASIMHSPQILFLDEPTSGIDVPSARQIRQLVKQMNQQGTTIFLTTHYIEEAERLCHRIAILVKGQIVRTGTPAELIEACRQEHVVELTVAEPISDLLSEFSEAFPTVSVSRAGDTALRLRSPEPLNISPFVSWFDVRQIPVIEARLVRPTLEDALVALTDIDAAAMEQGREGRRIRA